MESSLPLTVISLKKLYLLIWLLNLTIAAPPKWKSRIRNCCQVLKSNPGVEPKTFHCLYSSTPQQQVFFCQVCYVISLHGMDLVGIIASLVHEHFHERQDQAWVGCPSAMMARSYLSQCVPPHQLWCFLIGYWNISYGNLSCLHRHMHPLSC